MRALFLIASLLLAACDQSNTSIVGNKEISMDTNSNIQLAFACKKESIPEPEAEADVLFRYARWLQVNNQLKQDKEVDTEIGRLYRIAAENGHAKATINLQNGSLRGHFGLTASERRRFSQQLIDEGVASGYYFIAIYLQHGAAGLKQDEDMALRYYRKAADEGSALAQLYLGKKLEPVDIAPDVARQMYLCAAEQGDGEAAKIMGIIYKNDKNYQEAVRVYQLGVAAGNSTSASFLRYGFNEPSSDDPISYLGLKKDPERSRRYEAIWNILADYSYAHPTVPEINDIVPLPPAPLPEWDGKLKWLEAREANIPPEKPGEALIARLAKKKHLNPTTGRPLPESPDFDKQSASLLLCHSGEPCPRSGYWQTAWIPDSGTGPEEVRYFREGDTMPADRITRIHSRPWPLRDRHTEEEQPVTWRYLGEA